jgi:hypothetical protein
MPPPFAATLPESVGPYLVLMMVGFLIGGYGHLARARWMVAIGIILIFLATLIFPLANVLTRDEPPPPGPETPFSPGQ